MEEKFAALVNYLWEDCIKNLSTVLTKEEENRFSNNDYYYLLIIQSLNRPNFSQISERLSLTKPAVSAIIRKLTSMELVDKQQSEEDKRMFYVELTSKGQRILEGDKELYKLVVDMIKEIVIDEKELEIIERVISTLVDKILDIKKYKKKEKS